jgi:tryptophan 2,3-dioxygenase
MHYSDYLQLEKILNAQQPESDRLGEPAHDEMLFIVIHQTYELWFHQLLYETDSIIGILGQPTLNDNSPELQTIVHRLSRCATILKVLVHQIDIMETMTPMDFLDFRDKLRPASGFQSWQFKLLEARLGLKYENRFGQQYYLSQLRQPEIDRIQSAEKEPSLLQLLNNWLERMPFFDAGAAGVAAAGVAAAATVDLTAAGTFWTDYRSRYQQSLADAEKNNLEYFDTVFFGKPAAATAAPADATAASTTSAAASSATSPVACAYAAASPSATPPAPAPRSLSPQACRSALFIMLYRGYPLLQLPFQVLHQLLEIDEQLSTWRYRHMSMVARIIGTRIGTGGSTGKDYLASALERHHLFREIAALTSFLIERKRLPALDPEMEKRLGFVAAG